MKILTVLGTRPEAIKMAVLVEKLKTDPFFTHTLCVTGQHRQMLDQALHLFGMCPDIDLGIMQPSQDLTDVTCRTLVGMRDVLRDATPDLMLVHGDTSTCFAASLAAFYAGVPVGHVEAGLRTFNLQTPFPEEANRVFTARIAKYHFAPTQRSVDNLLREGIDLKRIVLTGNTVLDVLVTTAQRTVSFSANLRGTALEDLVRSGAKILLVTGHRRENFGRKLSNICNSLATLAGKYPEVQIVFPVHMNPNIYGPVRARLHNFDNIHLTEILSYQDFIFLMKYSFLILTDSGGIQEEAPALGKPVLVMRDITDRPEAVEAGGVRLVGTNHDTIVRGVSELLEDECLYRQMSEAKNPFGDGEASDRIIRFLKASCAAQEYRFAQDAVAVPE